MTLLPSPRPVKIVEHPDLRERSFTERFNRAKAMAFITDPNLIDDKTNEERAGSIAALKTYIKKSKDGYVTFKYKFGQGRTEGRIYAQGMQPLPHRIRHTIAGEFDHDIDIVNCHPTLLAQKCDELGISCEMLKRYIATRDEVLKGMEELYKVSRDDAKDLFIRLLNLGTYAAWARHHAITKKASKFIQDFEEELLKIQDLFWAKFTAKHKCYKKSLNPKASLVSFVIQVIENDILAEIVKFEEQRCGRTVSVLIFDGCQIRRDPAKPLTQTELDQCADYVFEQTGYRIQLIEKPMDHSYDVPDIVIENNPARVAHHLLCQNETEMGRKLIEVYGSNLIKCDNGILYVYDKSTGLWNSDELEILSVFEKSYELELGDWVTVNNQWKKLFERLHSLALDKGFLKRMELSAIGKILHTDGYFDIIEQKFIPAFDPKYFFAFRIDRPHNPTPNPAKIARAETLFSKLTYADDATGLFMKQNLARGLAGTGMRDKSGIMMIGPADSGKGVLTDALQQACCGYVGTFNAEVLLQTKNQGDPSLRIKEFVPKSQCRILLSNEISSNSIIDGTFWQKLTSGGDTQVGRVLNKNCVDFICQFLPIVMANDKPQIVPYNETDTGRTAIVNFPHRFTTNESKVGKGVFKLADQNIKDDFRKDDELKDALLHILIKSYVHEKPVPSETVRESTKLWTKSDNFELWFEENYEITGKDSDVVTAKEMLSATREAKFEITSTKIGLILKDFPGIKKIKTKSCNIYQGLKKLTETSVDSCLSCPASFPKCIIEPESPLPMKVKSI